LGRGAQQSVNDRIAALGTTLLTVMPGQARAAGGVASASDRAPLTIEDAQALEDRGVTIQAVQPEMSRQLQVQYQTHNTNTTITGTSANYLEVRLFSLAAGRMFTTADDAAKRRVAVVGAQALADLGAVSAESFVGAQLRTRLSSTIGGWPQARRRLLEPGAKSDSIQTPGTVWGGATLRRSTARPT
jgi:putative ABC transport system permease protein